MSDEQLSTVDLDVLSHMGSKDKTVSFRLKEEKFAQLKQISDRQDLSLSSMFRDYVDMLLAHDGKVNVVPEHQCPDGNPDDGFPVRVEVPKSFVREHDRIELENEHLREQLEEYKQYTTRLQDQLEEHDSDEVVRLEELDETLGRDTPEI